MVGEDPREGSSGVSLTVRTVENRPQEGSRGAPERDRERESEGTPRGSGTAGLERGDPKGSGTAGLKGVRARGRDRCEGESSPRGRPGLAAGLMESG